MSAQKQPECKEGGKKHRRSAQATSIECKYTVQVQVYRLNLHTGRDYLRMRAGFYGKTLKTLNVKSRIHALKLVDHTVEGK